MLDATRKLKRGSQTATELLCEPGQVIFHLWWMPFHLSASGLHHVYALWRRDWLSLGSLKYKKAPSTIKLQLGPSWPVLLRKGWGGGKWFPSLSHPKTMEKKLLRNDLKLYWAKSPKAKPGKRIATLYQVVKGLSGKRRKATPIWLKLSPSTH